MHRFSLIIATLAFGAIAFAQTPADAFQIAYSSNLNQGDSFVNITNGGALGDFLSLTRNGDICVNVYVFDPAQEMLACCSCLVTPDGLNSFSVKNDLINKTLTPAVPTSVVIKLVATANSNTQGGGVTTCKNSAAATTGFAYVPGMRAWATTLHQGPLGTYQVTENAFQPVTVGSAEAGSLPQFCGFVIAEGSGNFGFCNNACANNGLAGAKK